MVAQKKELYAAKSPYGSYKVVDTQYNGRPARVLYGEKGSAQSGMALDADPELLFEYNQRFLELIMSKCPKRILVIGGGAFMLPIAVFQRFPLLKIDVVEIDGLLVKIAADFFGLPKSKRLNVYAEDGVAYARRTRHRYDMIIIDAFSGYTIPPHLIEHDALKTYKKRLSKHGVVAINFISSYKPRRPRLAHELLASFEEVFAWQALYQADPEYFRGEEQNLLLVAGNKPEHFMYLQSEEVARIDER